MIIHIAAKNPSQSRRKYRNLPRAAFGREESFGNWRPATAGLRGTDDAGYPDRPRPLYRRTRKTVSNRRLPSSGHPVQPLNGQFAFDEVGQDHQLIVIRRTPQTVAGAAGISLVCLEFIDSRRARSARRVALQQPMVFGKRP